MQRVYQGPGSVRKIGQIIKSRHAKKVFAVTGKGSFAASGAKAALERSLGGAELVGFSDFQVNPRLEDALAGIRQLKRCTPDVIVAVGGGSVLDMAKLINALAANPCEDYAQSIRTCKVARKGLPLIAVPTTAGTGSEATHFAVVYIEKKKYSLAHPAMLPDYAVIDADLTASAAPYQAAASGMDALCQAVESYWCVNANHDSREYAAQAIRIILPAIKKAVLDSDRTARQEMALGAHLAGKAINITKTTAPHALSYPLTTYHGLPHGHAVALVLGKFFQINETRIRSPRENLCSRCLSQTFDALYRMFGCSSAGDCSAHWYSLMEDIGLSTDMIKLGIKAPEDIQRILDNVNPERLRNHPVHIQRSDLAGIFPNPEI